MITDGLVYRLLEAGLLQPGIFEKDADALWHWRLDMLPSYPELLAMVSASITEMIQDMPIDRLVCSPAALPLGILVSAETQLPLVYSRGQGETPVYDLVGAYDIGHPACLLVYKTSEPDIESIIRSGQSVGLNVLSVMALVDDALPSLTVPLHSILHSSDIEGVLRTTFKNGGI